LIDNFHQAERQVREIRTDLPPGYYRQLPKLAEGPFARYPRVFEIAWAFVAHTDSRFDVDSWCGFLRAYQEVQYLTIGELWASAITLRLILIENLRRIADRVVYSRNERSKADELADRLPGVDGRSAKPSATIQKELERTELPDAFLVQLIPPDSPHVFQPHDGPHLAVSLRTIASYCALRILPPTDFHRWQPLQDADGEVSAGVGGAIAVGDEVVSL
jgi:hypothetical protein